jgi:hypothetical protein
VKFVGIYLFRYGWAVVISGRRDNR